MGNEAKAEAEKIKVKTGRKPLDADDDTKVLTVRVTKSLKTAVVERGGSEWVRQVIVRAIAENW